jgi:hypothetical protein
LVILFFDLIFVLISAGAFALNNHFHIVNITYSVSDVLLLSIVIGISSLIVISLRQIDYLSASLRKKWEFCEIYLREQDFDAYLHEKYPRKYDVERIARDQKNFDQEAIDRLNTELAREIIERRKQSFGKMKMREITVKTFEVMKLGDMDRRIGIGKPIHWDDPFVTTIDEWNEIPWQEDRSRIVEYASEQVALRGVIAWLGHNGWEPVYINFDIGEKWVAPRGLFKREIH